MSLIKVLLSQILKGLFFACYPYITERFMAQDTTMFLSANACRVHLAVILTVESSPGRLDKPLYAVSGVIKDGSKCYLQSFWY